MRIEMEMMTESFPVPCRSFSVRREDGLGIAISLSRMTEGSVWVWVRRSDQPSGKGIQVSLDDLAKGLLPIIEAEFARREAKQKEKETS